MGFAPFISSIPNSTVPISSSQIRPVQNSIYFNGLNSYRPNTNFAFPHQRYFGSQAVTNSLTSFQPNAAAWLDPKQVSQWNTHANLMSFQLSGPAFADRIAYPSFSMANIPGFLGSGGLPQPWPGMYGGSAFGGMYGGGLYGGGGFAGNNYQPVGLDYLAGGILGAKGLFSLFA